MFVDQMVLPMLMNVNYKDLSATRRKPFQWSIMALVVSAKFYMIIVLIEQSDALFSNFNLKYLNRIFFKYKNYVRNDMMTFYFNMLFCSAGDLKSI